MGRHMTVSFGMVSVPVRLEKATEDEKGGVSFRGLCPHCLQPAKSKSHCPQDGHEVGYAEKVKGIEAAKGQFVTFTETEIDELPLRTMKSIDVEKFVDPAEIPTDVYHTGSYFLEPEEIGKKAFALLRSALVETRRVGVAKVSVGTRERICMVKPWGERGLLLVTLHWPENVRAASEPAIPSVLPDETALAAQLVKALSGHWTPDEFKDGYKAAVLEAVEAKRAGNPMPKAAPAPDHDVVDLMEALKASIAATKKPEPKPKPVSRRKAA